MKTTIAEKSSIEEEAASIIPRSRASWRSFVSLAGKTCKKQELSGISSGFSFSFLFSSDGRKNKMRKMTRASYIDDQRWKKGVDPGH